MEKHKKSKACALVAAVFFLLPAIAEGLARPTMRRQTPLAPTETQALDCEAKAQTMANNFRVDTPLQRNARLMELDPDALCQVNKPAYGDRRSGQNSIQQASICQATYKNLREALEKYRLAVVRACERAKNVRGACEAVANPTECMARMAREAAALDDEAANLLTEAKLQASDFAEHSARARDQYMADKRAIDEAMRRNQAAIDAAKLAGDAKKEADLIKLRNDAVSVVSGELSMEGNGLLGMISGDGANVIPSRRGGDNITIATYVSRITGGNANTLAGEQDLAFRTAGAFNTRANAEITERTRSAASLRSYATELDALATRQTTSLAPNAVKNTPTPDGLSSLTGMTAPLAAAQQLAAVANQPVPPGGANGLLSQAASSIPGFVPGLAGGTATGPEKNLFGTGGTRGAGSNPIGTVDPTKNPGDGRVATSVGPNGEGFINGSPGSLSGRGENGNASRSLASELRAAMAKAGSGEGGRDADLAGKRKKKGVGEEEKPCAKDSDCAAVAQLETAQFNKGGSLGMPVVGAKDPALETLGALDKLFTGLPGDADPNKLPAGAALGLSGAGIGFSGLGDNFDAAGGDTAKLAGTGVAPENSRSLFSRVRLVHERAQKKGAVNLYHKKL